MITDAEYNRSLFGASGKKVTIDVALVESELGIMPAVMQAW